MKKDIITKSAMIKGKEWGLVYDVTGMNKEQKTHITNIMDIAIERRRKQLIKSHHMSAK